MKIYNKIIMDWDGNVLEEQSSEYDGPVALCRTKSGGGSTTTRQIIEGGYDAEYNAGMLAIAQEQMGMSKEMFAWWKEHQAPYEAALSAAGLRLLPYQEAYNTEAIQSQRHLLPYQTQSGISGLELDRNTSALGQYLAPHYAMLEQDEIMKQKQMMPHQAIAQQEFYKDAYMGVDPMEWAARAGTDAAAAHAGADAALRRDAARMGIDPSSGRFGANQASYGLQLARDVAQARSLGYKAGEDENWARRKAAMTASQGGPNVQIGI